MPNLKRKKIELAAATLIVAAVLGASVTLSPLFFPTLVVVSGLWSIMLYDAFGTKGWGRKGSEIS